jgi:hypothetical protein
VIPPKEEQTGQKGVDFPEILETKKNRLNCEKIKRSVTKPNYFK